MQVAQVLQAHHVRVCAPRSYVFHGLRRGPQVGLIRSISRRSARWWNSWRCPCRPPAQPRHAGYRCAGIPASRPTPSDGRPRGPLTSDHSASSVPPLGALATVAWMRCGEQRGLRASHHSPAVAVTCTHCQASLHRSPVASLGLGDAMWVNTCRFSLLELRLPAQGCQRHLQRRFGRRPVVLGAVSVAPGSRCPPLSTPCA